MFWSIRTKLQMEGLKRDLALFNLAIDTKLQGCSRCRPAASMTWRPTAMHSIVRQSARRRRADRPDATGDRRVFEANRPKDTGTMIMAPLAAAACATSAESERTVIPDRYVEHVGAARLWAQTSLTPSPRTGRHVRML